MIQRYADVLQSFKKSKPKIKHGDLVNTCIKTLFSYGCYVWPHNTGAYRTEYTRKDGTKLKRLIRYGKKGSSDIIGLTSYGRFIGCEVKTEDDEQSYEQSLFQQYVESRKGLYILAYSVDDLISRYKEIRGEL